MEIKRVARIDALSPDDLAIVPYFAGEGLDESIRTQVGALKLAGLDDARRRGELKGTLYRTDLFRGTPSVMFVGLGKRATYEGVYGVRTIQAATRVGLRLGFSSMAVVAANNAFDAAGGIRGALLGAYDEEILKTSERRDTDLKELTLVGTTEGGNDVERARIVGESANLTRDLINLPPNDLTPSVLAERAVAVAEEVGLSVEVVKEDQIENLGMGALLGVTKGSSEPPRVVNLGYGDETATTKLFFVGKGLTFDSGGLSLKPAAGMEWMKGDMSGAAAVIGAMRAIGLLKPQGILVRGLIGTVENMPGPAAMKPGDVLRTMAGKTIEVLNTDAEGRLVLSDILAYAVKLGATHIVDLATLTGSAVITLGHEAAVVIGRPQTWVDEVRGVADSAFERLWQLPLYPEYRKQIDSDIADMKNTGGRYGGALTAAALLAEFVDNVPWAHLDIAGTAFLEKKTKYAPTGGTGYGVATLVDLAFKLAG